MSAADYLFGLQEAPKNLNMTPARLKALQQGHKDGGEIILGGIDETVPCPRRDVVVALYHMGYLFPPIGLRCEIFKFTQQAKDYFE